MSSSTPPTKICFNPGCKDPKSERFRRGWRLRNGEFAELCDRCAAAYEEGRFCEQFHMKSAGWRSCHYCGKLLHCGCIISINAHVLLDVGGVECIACARKKHSVMASNPSWSPASLPQSERFKDISIKNWNPVAVPNGGGGQWWHTANARNVVTSQSEVYPRLPCEVDRPSGIDKVISTERPSVSGLERVLEDPSGRAEPSSHNLSVDRISSKNAGVDMVVGLKAFRREEGTLDVLTDSCKLPGENGSVDARKGLIAEPGLNTSAAGMSFDAHSNSGLNISLQSSTAKDPLILQHGKLVPYTPSSETNGSTSVSGTQTPPVPLSKKFYSDSQNGVDSSAETQMRNGKARGDARGRPRLLPRYWPKITDQELQQISGDSSLVVTPLFEKILSASDAGRIGRLVLPKRCAETHLPTISQPEGVPLRVQDAKGKEWVFQFRFWPNNNSRMYVLEGVTPCIQNMQLQAGDTVTFSRMDPDGKLVMGFRKTSTSPPSNQDNPKLKIGNGNSKHAEANLKEANTWSEVDKSGYIANDALRAKSDLFPSKKKSSALGLKSKRLQIDNVDLIELQLTWEEAQGLLRPPLNHVPIVVVVEGRAFEEYEEPPTLGKPTIFTTNDCGENIQWAQCEECYKWRKLPVDALLPSQWTCSDNLWDAKRSSCSSDQELTDGQLQDLLDSSSNVTSKKNKSARKDSDTVGQSEGLDTLANLAILGEAEALPSAVQPPTTKHPRHRPGCTCIVCIQPPSGKGPKHSDTCICNVCLTVRRRFRTLMERRGKRPPENEPGTSKKKQQKLEKPQQVDDVPGSSKPNGGVNKETVVNGIDADDDNHKNPCSPFKGRIDLNIQPEREDDSSPVSSSSIILRFLRDPSEVQHRQQRLASSSENRGLDQLGTNASGSEVVGADDNLGNGVSNSCDQEDADMDRHVPLSAWIPDT